MIRLKNYSFPVSSILGCNTSIIVKAYFFVNTSVYNLKCLVDMDKVTNDMKIDNIDELHIFLSYRLLLSDNNNKISEYILSVDTI